MYYRRILTKKILVRFNHTNQTTIEKKSLRIPILQNSHKNHLNQRGSRNCAPLQAMRPNFSFLLSYAFADNKSIVYEHYPLKIKIKIDTQGINARYISQSLSIPTYLCTTCTNSPHYLSEQTKKFAAYLCSLFIHLAVSRWTRDILVLHTEAGI